MISYTDEYVSEKYYPGSIFETKNYGKIEILGKPVPGIPNHYIIKFNDTGTTTIVHTKRINDGFCIDRNRRSVCGVGYHGYGKYNSYFNGKIRKEYSLWHGMLARCYNKNEPSYMQYGNKGVTVCDRWHNFQNFCEDIKNLENYEVWKKSRHTKQYELDKDTLQKHIPTNKKVYSPSTCIFLDYYLNIQETLIRNKFKKFVGFRISDGYKEEHYNQTEFSKKYNLCSKAINACLKGKYKTTKGWKFEYID